MTSELDTVVIGGGPAGVACATVLARGGQAVALLESGDFTDYRVGEVLHSEVRPLLHRVGVLESDINRYGRPVPAILSAWGDESLRSTNYIFSPYGNGWLVDRCEFDRLLFRHAAASGVQAWSSCTIQSARREGGRWYINTLLGAVVAELRTPLVVEATGRGHNSACSQSRDYFWHDRLIGLARHTEDKLSLDPYHGALLVESAPDGWWYSVRWSDNRFVFIFLTDADLIPSGSVRIGFLADQAEATVHTRQRMRALDVNTWQGNCRGFDARCGVRRHAGSSWWIPVGDNLTSFDPLAGRGVVHALRSGISLAEGLLTFGSDNTLKRREWIDERIAVFNSHLLEKSIAYQSEQRWAQRVFWQRRGAMSRHDGLP